MNVLVADIGGTKTNVGIFSVKELQVESLFEVTYHSHEYASIEEIIVLFISQVMTQAKGQILIDSINNVCLGVAGPIKNNYCALTNLPWVIDAKYLQKQFSWQSVNLLNDLEANAWGIGTLKEDDYITLNLGEASTGKAGASNASIIAAGTGLGEAGLFWDGHQHIPFASEGGHTDFSPSTEQEYRLHQFLSHKYKGHVSWERIVSGMGLENLYLFLCHDKQVEVPTWLQQQIQMGDAAEAISKAATEAKDALCQEALEWFVYLYGVEAANHALKIMSMGGVFLGGGIAPKIIKHLQTGRFMQAFCAKGRMQAILQAMPVKVIMNDKTALYGSAFYASKHAQ